MPPKNYKPKPWWTVFWRDGKLDAVDETVDDVPEGVTVIANITCNSKQDAIEYVEVNIL